MLTSSHDRACAGILFEFYQKVIAHLPGQPAKKFLEKVFYDVFCQEMIELTDIDLQRAKARKDCGKFEAKLL